MMLKLKLQYFDHLMQRVDSLEKTLMLGGLGAGGEGDDRGWDGSMASPTWWTWVWVNSRSWWWTGRPGVLQFMGLQRVGHNWATELNWTGLMSSTSVKATLWADEKVELCILYTSWKVEYWYHLNWLTFTLYLVAFMYLVSTLCLCEHVLWNWFH